MIIVISLFLFCFFGVDIFANSAVEVLSHHIACVLV